MKTDKTTAKSGTIAFAGFALLIAMRDILVELWLDEDYVALAFLICCTISGLGLLSVLASRKLGALLDKLRSPKLVQKVVLFGVLTGVLYSVGLFLVQKLGAGLFNMVDYGLTPLATTIVGIVAFKNRFTRKTAAAFLVYLVGMLLLNWGRGMEGWKYIGVAMLLPLITASTDGLSAWLRDPIRGNVGRSELLVLRFLPAAIALGLYALLSPEHGIALNNGVKASVVAVVCGFVPLFLLASVIRPETMGRLAAWEFVIPSIAFFGTLHAHVEDNARPLPVLGATVVLLSMLISETKVGDWLTGGHIRSVGSSPAQ